MRVSLHRRRNQSLPPTPRRSPKILIFVLALCTGTMALAASHIGASKPPPAINPAVRDADAATRVAVDERIHAHLAKLQRAMD
ncbi:MAG TPA: hypothetical protein VGO62_19595 [Myxococcota bacterium]|jgi:hypothetical protein